ncbi:MAG TPA: 30S ribosomal protein S2 [Patescibacteria group bacterium]|nr:30S ribosomal protein S2 [Patescibacteria group bacterium]
MTNIPSLIELTKKGAHLGHETYRRFPEMSKFISGKKNTLHIIDLTKTRQCLKEARDFLKKATKESKNILLVGTKPGANDIVKKYGEEFGLPYVNKRWLGGMITNFKTVKKLIEKFNSMRKEKKAGEWDKYTKKEQVDFEKELNKLEGLVGGIRNIKEAPKALYIIDTVDEDIALEEAKKENIPVIALINTDENPNRVDYPIPCNNDSSKTLEVITESVLKAIQK